MVPTRWQAILAGIAAGAIGGAALLAYMVLASLANQDPWWRYPNLLGSAFYGPIGLRAGPGLATVAGAALQVIVSGAVGAVFSAAFVRRFRGRRLVLLGAVMGLAYLYLANTVAGRFAPLIALYTPTAAATVGFILLGLCLALARSFVPVALTVRGASSEKVESANDGHTIHTSPAALLETAGDGDTTPRTRDDADAGDKP